MSDDTSRSGAAPGDGGPESTSSVSDTDLSMLMSSATIVILGQALYSVSSLLERAIIANTLSLDAYAQVGIGFSVLLLGSNVCLFGVGQAIPRFMSRFDDDVDVRGVYVTGLLVMIPVSIVVTAVLYSQVELIGSYLLDEGDSTRLLSLFVLAIPLLALLKATSSAIRGMENTVYYIFAQRFAYPGLRLVLLSAFLGLGWGIAAAGYAYIASAGIVFVVALLLLRRLLPFRGAARTRTREMLRFSAPLLLSGIASNLLTKSDTLLVAFFRTQTEVAYYEAAYPLANGLLVFLSAFGFLYLPMASRLDSEDRVSEVDSIYKLTTKWIFLLTFPVFVLLFAFPTDVLRIVFQPQYTGAWPALSVLALGFLSQAGSGRCTETLSAFGHTRTIFLINVGTFLLNLALNLALIPRYGFIAAAAASAVAFTLQNVVTIAVLWWRFRITPFAPSTLRTFLALPAVIVPLSVLLSNTVTLSILSFVGLIVLLPVASLAVYLLAGCAEPEDRIAIDIVEGKLGRRLPFVDRLLPSRDD